MLAFGNGHSNVDVRLLPGTTSGARSASRRMKEARAGAKPRAPRPSRPRPPRTPVLGPNGKPMVKCSSCRQFGHTKSNRKCPNHPGERFRAVIPVTFTNEIWAQTILF